MTEQNSFSITFGVHGASMNKKLRSGALKLTL